MIEIIDDFIPSEMQDSLESLLIGNNTFPYFHCLDTVEYQKERQLFVDKNIIHQPQFVHVLFTNDTINSQFFYTILEKFAATFSGFPDYTFKRVKVNLLNPPIEKRKDCYHLPHFDSKNEKDITVLYYVSDSDGDTFFFNEKFKNEFIPNEVTLQKRITPKKGRAVIFNSNQFHASSPPTTKDFRCVINMVFTLSNQSEHNQNLQNH